MSIYFFLVCRQIWISVPYMLFLFRLPSTMATNLSVPLAFVALLHLANEKVWVCNRIFYWLHGICIWSWLPLIYMHLWSNGCNIIFIQNLKACLSINRTWSCTRLMAWLISSLNKAIKNIYFFKTKYRICIISLIFLYVNLMSTSCQQLPRNWFLESC